MPKAFYKRKLLFDENMPPRTQYPRLNEHFDVKHVSHDYNKGGVADEEVYKMACKQRRITITINRDDFAKLVGTNDDCGVIAVRRPQLELIQNSLRFSCSMAPTIFEDDWFRSVQKK
jgi:predicted nuclease of predicted toxin-antitoxin system